MTDDKKIPQTVKDAAKGLVDMFGSHFEYLGQYEGADFYMFEFPDGSMNGFPEVYQYENGEVLTLTGFAALDIINLLVKE